MTTDGGARTPLEREVASRFGLLPNFFVSAPDAPELVAKLWDFAKAAYIEAPIPSLFKERLFISLSRYCQVRYCVTRHCGFLLGLGRPAGDPAAGIQTIEQALALLKSPTPWERNLEPVFAGLDSTPADHDWPAPEAALEDWLFTAATLLFVEPARAGRARQALRRVLGGRRFEFLLGLLAFIRAAHYWTVVHPDLVLENDLLLLLDGNKELARLLLEDVEASRTGVAEQLFQELEGLRESQARRELEASNRALQSQVYFKEMLLKEVNHRVKNSLQIASSILRLQEHSAEQVGAGEMMRSAAARVMAIAAVHQRLYAGDDVRTVALHDFLKDLCEEIARTLSRPDSISVIAEPVEVPTDMAVPLALITNELVTNAIRHAGAPCSITLRRSTDGGFSLHFSDTGPGPAAGAVGGMGTKIVNALASQIGARFVPSRSIDGYTVELVVPLAPHDGAHSTA